MNRSFHQTHRRAALVLAGSIAALLATQSVQAATKTYDGGTGGTGTALDTNTNWVGDVLPVTTDEVLLNNSVITLPASLTTTGASVTYGDLILNNNASTAITINTSGATSRTITLSGGGGSTAAIAAGGATGDLLLMGTTATTNTLTIGGNAGVGTARLNLVLGASGNFDVVASGATLAVTASISETGGARAITKTGAGTLILSGTNTYTGGTAVNTGILTFLNTSAKPSAGTTTVAAGATLALGVATSGSFFNSADIDSLFAGTLANVTNDATSNVGIDTTQGNFTYASSVGGSPTKGLTKLGINALILTGASTYTGATTISTGTLTINGAGSITGGGALTLNSGYAGAALAAPIFNYDSSATSTVAGITVGNGGNRTATFNQTNGTINATSLVLGPQASSTGIVNLSGGTLAVSGGVTLSSRTGLTFQNQINLSGSGNLTAASLTVGAFSSGATSTGLFNQTGGTATISGALTVAANSSDAVVHVGTVSLSGGTLTVGSIAGGTASGGGTNLSVFNFNGGTLKPGASTASFMSGLTAAYVYGGNAIIDTNGSDITIGQALLATNDNGVSTVSAISGGSGYTASSGTLAVTFSAPSGANPRAASGYAATNSSGVVTGITVIDPGNGYTSAPTFTVASGGSGASGTVNFGFPTGITTTGGGLTKQGAGTLTLSGANTFTGSTLVSGGTLALGNNLALQNSAIDTSGAGVITLTGFTTPTFGGLVDGAGQQALASVITTGYSAVTALTLNPGTGASDSYSGVIADGVAGMTLNKTGAGTQILSGASTYTGATMINGGTLEAKAFAAYGANSAIGTGTAQTLANSAQTLVINGGTLKFTGTAGDGSTDRLFTIGTNGATIDGSSSDNTALTFTNAGSIATTAGATDRTLTLTGTTSAATLNSIASVIVNPTGGGKTAVTKTGSNTWVLSGANTYTGTTTIDNGTLAFTTVSPALTGSVTFGAAAGNTTVGALDVSGVASTATFTGALLVQNNDATGNTIAVGSKTLTINGGMTLGYDAGSGTGTTNSKLTVTGAGTMAVNGTTITLGVNQAASNAAYFSTGTLDVTGLGNFTTNVTNLNLGVASTTGSVGNLLLSNTANTLKATTLSVGDSGGSNSTGNSTLTLGAGTNVINANTINIGITKSGGSIKFASQTAGSPGTVTIANKAGTGAATITVGNANGTSTSGTATSTLNLTGHVATVNAGTLLIGQNNMTGSTGSTTGTVSFDGGTFTVATLTMAPKSGAGTGNANAILTIGGGAFTVNTAFTLGSQATAGTSFPTLAITGGTFTSNANIVEGGGTVTSVINLNGPSAVLDMAGGVAVHNIGDATNVINTFTFTDGTLRNIGTVFGGITLAGAGSRVFDETGSFSGEVKGVISGTSIGLQKTGSGTILLSNTNTYTGPTTVTGGTLNVSGGITGSTSVSLTGGTLLLTSTTGGTKLNSTADVTLNGGKIDLTGITTATISQSVGALSLSGSSSIDFGTLNGNTFKFADSSAKDWTSFTLSVYDWSAGVDHLFFGTNDSSGLTGTQLGQITFYGGNPSSPGTALGTAAFISGGGGELAAVPEPSSSGMLAAAGLFGLIGYRERRRMRWIRGSGAGPR